MGCFLACFGSSKNRKQRKGSPRRQLSRGSPRRQRHGGSYEPLKSSVIIKQEIVVEPAALVAECPTAVKSSEKFEEQLSPSLKKKVDEQLSSGGTKKKVTFDLNVRAYEGVAVEEVIYISESEDDEEGKGNKEDGIGKKWQTSEDSNSNSSSSGSFPSNHRYGNCTNSDDEYEGTESGDSDLDDEEEDGDDDDYDYEDDDYEESERRLVEAESSESFFSLPMDSRNAAIPVGEKEVNSPLKVDTPLEQEKKTFGSNPNARDRSQYIHSVLNPVENLSQWKVVKARAQSPSPLKLQKKENINLEQESTIPFSAEPTFKLSSFTFNPNVIQSSSPPSKEIAVDASLSTWLGSCESTPSIKSSNVSIARTGSAEVNKSPRSNSPCSIEERPILGALTLEELKQFSATSSPRRSPTHSPDEMPILGTVGSYWSQTNQTTDSSSGSSCKGIPNTTSKYREDKRVSWHSTPFETRLERALQRGTAGAYTSQ
ncbi:hypothetical protein MKW94_030890 [Papaver nudicaule]|uniref:Uncharacterized protein n=1 Tax=Papaver nudicaule TaxID=74823 RepID=A0AA41V4C8_PAPNU|nr:hypothetical protein [Papaver nudicaule]